MSKIVEAYNANRYKNNFNFFNIDGLPIPFLKDSKRILIWMSGGADSALLSYLLCEYITENNLDVEVHVLQFIRKWEKAPWQQTIGKGVYNYFVTKFNNINFTRHEALIPTLVEHVVFVDKNDAYAKKEIIDFTGGDVVLTNENCYFITAKYNIDINYNATTRNPPINFDNRVRSRDIDCDGSEKSSFKLLGKANPLNSYNCNPFIYTDKSWVIKQYKDRNLLDLLNITRSCEAYISGIDYSNWDNNVDLLEDCNTECYWCQERNWALEQNGLLKFKNKFGKVNVL